MENFIMDKKYLWINILLMFFTYGIWAIIYIILRSQYSTNRKTAVSSSKSEPIMYSKIVGVTHGDRQQYLRKCKSGQKLIIIWEKDNQYSKNALAVYTNFGNDSYQLGYLPDDTAADLFKRFYTSEKSYLIGYIQQITGNETLGCNIRIYKQ